MVKKILSLKGLVVLEVILLVNLLVIGVREGFNQDITRLSILLVFGILITLFNSIDFKKK